MNTQLEAWLLMWHCVLDRNNKLIYLGTDEAEACKFAVEGTVMRSADTMGNAMLSAAMAFGDGKRK